jgi:hypothetical protein
MFGKSTLNGETSQIVSQRDTWQVSNEKRHHLYSDSELDTGRNKKITKKRAETDETIRK